MFTSRLFCFCCVKTHWCHPSNRRPGLRSKMPSVTWGPATRKNTEIHPSRTCKVKKLSLVFRKPPLRPLPLIMYILTNMWELLFWSSSFLLWHSFFLFTFPTMFFHLEGGQFPCTDDCQVTFVNLKCDSSKKRRRGRKSPSKEVSHITAEFEMEMKEEEASGVVFFPHVSHLTPNRCNVTYMYLTSYNKTLRRN